jgi:hypothetical protein
MLLVKATVVPAANEDWELSVKREGEGWRKKKKINTKIRRFESGSIIAYF